MFDFLLFAQTVLPSGGEPSGFSLPVPPGLDLSTSAAALIGLVLVIATTKLDGVPVWRLVIDRLRMRRPDGGTRHAVIAVSDVPTTSEQTRAILALRRRLQAAGETALLAHCDDLLIWSLGHEDI